MVDTIDRLQAENEVPYRPSPGPLHILVHVREQENVIIALLYSKSINYLPNKEAHMPYCKIISEAVNILPRFRRIMAVCVLSNVK